jgi:hypothetical protein
MILLKSLKVKIKGSKISKTRAREGEASVFPSFLFPKIAASANRAIQQAGKKEEGFECHPHQEFLPACSESEAPPPCSLKVEPNKKVFFCVLDGK